MADSTISGSDPRRLQSREDDTTALVSGPPPKKTSSTSDATHPTLTGPTTYDVKDVAKFMPATPLTSAPKQATLSLDAQKATVDKRLASPTDYPQRKYDEALREDLGRRILDRDTQAKVAAKDLQCPAWAACQPVPNGYDPAPAGSIGLVRDAADGSVQATAVRTDDGHARLGFVDATTTPTPRGERVDQLSLGILKLQNESTNSSGVKSTTTVQVGSASAQTGFTNPDGSRGVGFDVGATVVGVERTSTAPDGSGLTLGVSLGAAGGGSYGVKKTANGGEAICGRAELGPVTLGACQPTVHGGSDT